jgi:GNAT superfamily N-acetyltransferase
MSNIQITERCNFSANEISAFIESIFDEYIAPEYTQEGVSEFKTYIDPAKITERLSNNHFLLFALDEENKLAGVLEMRNCDHLSMLFIRKDMQRKGIGKRLLLGAINRCLKETPELKEISIASSPNSIKAYEKMGFHVIEDEKVIRGLRFIPMVYKVGHTPQYSI